MGAFGEEEREGVVCLSGGGIVVFGGEAVVGCR